VIETLHSSHWDAVTRASVTGSKTVGITDSYPMKIPANMPLNCKKNCSNRTACIKHQCRKTTVLSCHRCLINTGVEKMKNIQVQIRSSATRCL